MDYQDSIEKRFPQYITGPRENLELHRFTNADINSLTLEECEDLAEHCYNAKYCTHATLEEIRLCGKLQRLIGLRKGRLNRKK